MGIDLDAHIETFTDGKWEHFGKLDVPRNSKLIAKIIGGRETSIERYRPPRGFPSDASWQAEKDYYGRFDVLPEFEGVTWLSKSECEFIQGWWMNQMHREKFLVPLVDDYRVIFWFSDFDERDYEGNYERLYGTGDPDSSERMAD